MKFDKRIKLNKSVYQLVFWYMVTYVCSYYIQPIMPAVVLITVVLSYYRIIKNNDFAPVIMLILSARTINGFVIPSLPSMYTIMMVLTYYLPSIVFFAINIIRQNNKLSVKKRKVKKYKYLLIYLFYIISCFVLNITIAKSMFLVAVLPLILFAFFIIVLPEKSYTCCVDEIILYLRMIFLVSLVIYVLPNYKNITEQLLLSGKVFGEPTALEGTYMFMGFFRNNGVFFDCRILAIFTYIQLYLVGSRFCKISVFDIILCTITVLSTLSRGGIAVYCIVLLGYLLISEKSKKKTIFMVMASVIGFFTLVLYIPNMSENSAQYFSTFNIMKANNVLSQRSVMSDYAMDAFYKHPVIGNGYGSLMARGIERDVYHDIHGVSYTVVTDAYIFSSLGEIGIIGTFLFIIQLFSVIYNKKDNKTMSSLLFVGIMLQLLGTDIPNMRLVYFVILMLISIANMCEKSIEYTNKGE